MANTLSGGSPRHRHLNKPFLLNMVGTCYFKRTQYLEGEGIVVPGMKLYQVRRLE